MLRVVEEDTSLDQQIETVTGFLEMGCQWLNSIPPETSGAVRKQIDSGLRQRIRGRFWWASSTAFDIMPLASRQTLEEASQVGSFRTPMAPETCSEWRTSDQVCIEENGIA